MTGQRAQAYGRVMSTLQELAGVKLQPREQDRIRDAADTLLFCDDPARVEARDALADIEALTGSLAENGRLTEERARRLADEVAACGPVTSVV